MRVRSSEPSVSRQQVAVDLLGGLAMLAVVAVALLNVGEGRLDWIFPKVLAYSLGVVAVYLIIRGLLGYGERVAAVPPILQGKGVDVAVFVGLILAYVLLVQPVGFWVMSVATIVAGAIYLDVALSVARVLIALAVAVSICVLAYWLLTYVFYVPFPEFRWL